jgi:integrase
MQKRKWVKEKKYFWCKKGLLKGKPMSVCGIQKRIEYYAKKTKIQVSCHHLRHTMATQVLNADSILLPFGICWDRLLQGNKCRVAEYPADKARQL